jgi:hypothetical protein
MLDSVDFKAASELRRFRDQIPVMQFQCPCRMFRGSPGYQCSMNFVQKFVGTGRSREQVPLVPAIMKNVQGKSRVPMFREPCSEVCGNQEVQGTGSIKLQFSMQDVQGKFQGPEGP